MNTTPITPLREHIPIGKENAITSEDLAARWGVTERDARRIIAKMRITQTDDPYAILSEDGYPGFWRSDVHAELECMIKRSRAKAVHTYMTGSDAMRVLSGQIAVAPLTGEARPARAGNQRFPAALPELCKAKSPVRLQQSRAASRPRPAHANPSDSSMALPEPAKQSPVRHNRGR